MKRLAIFFAVATLAATAGVSRSKRMKRELSGWQWQDPSYRLYDHQDQNRRQPFAFEGYSGSVQNIGHSMPSPSPTLPFENLLIAATATSSPLSSIPTFSLVSTEANVLATAVPAVSTVGNSPLPITVSPAPAIASAPVSTNAPIADTNELQLPVSAATIIPQLALKQNPDPGMTAAPFTSTDAPDVSFRKEPTTPAELPAISYNPSPSKLAVSLPVRQVDLAALQRTGMEYTPSIRISMPQAFQTSVALPALAAPTQTIDYTHPDLSRTTLSGDSIILSTPVQQLGLGHAFGKLGSLGYSPFQTGLNLNLGGYGGIDYGDHQRTIETQPFSLGIAKVGLGAPALAPAPVMTKIGLGYRLW